jgi:hypothetical protein
MNIPVPVIDTIKKWAMIVVVIYAVVMSVIAVVQYYQNQTLQSEKATLQEKLNTKDTLLGLQNFMADINATDPVKVEQLPIRITRIDKEFVPVKVEIIKWRENNETNDCNRSSHLYGFDFSGMFNRAITAADRESTAESTD